MDRFTRTLGNGRRRSFRRIMRASWGLVAMATPAAASCLLPCPLLHVTHSLRDGRPGLSHTRLHAASCGAQLKNKNGHSGQSNCGPACRSSVTTNDSVIFIYGKRPKPNCSYLSLITLHSRDHWIATHTTCSWQQDKSKISLQEHLEHNTGLTMSEQMLCTW